jgi:hypothetical protein
MARPIILLGVEKNALVPTVWADPTFRFDGQVGVWRTTDGGLAVSSAGLPGTTRTATREGVDQTDVSFMSTLQTETREGVDQSERAERAGH